MKIEAIKNEISNKYYTKYIFKIIELLKNKLNIKKSVPCYYLGYYNLYTIFLCKKILYIVYSEKFDNKNNDLPFKDVTIKSLYSVKLLVKEPQTEKDIEFTTIINENQQSNCTPQEFLNWLDEPCNLTEKIDYPFSKVIKFLNSYQKETFKTKDYIFYIKKDNDFSYITNFYAYDIKNKTTMKLYTFEYWDEARKEYLPPTYLSNITVEVLHGKLSSYQQRKCKLEFLKFAYQYSIDEEIIERNYWLMELVKQTIQPIENTQGWSIHRVFAGKGDGKPKKFTNIWVEDFPNSEEEPWFFLTNNPIHNITKVACIDFKSATYHSYTGYKSGCIKYKDWDLDEKYLKELVEFLKSPVDKRDYYNIPKKYVKTNWQKLIFEYNHNTVGWGWSDTGFNIPPEKDKNILSNLEPLPFDLPMPDYTKITYSTIFEWQEWTAPKFQLFNDLKEYLDSLNLIGQPINKIFVMGNIFNNVDTYYDFVNGKWYYYDSGNNYISADDICSGLLKPNDVENVGLELDEPIILQIVDKQLEIRYCEDFNAQIGVNTLNKTVISPHSSVEHWQNVSKHFSKNIIGHKIIDIEIEPFKIREDINSEGFGIYKVSHKKGDISYIKFALILDNSYKLVFKTVCGDYMGVYEEKNK